MKYVIKTTWVLGKQLFTEITIFRTIKPPIWRRKGNGTATGEVGQNKHISNSLCSFLVVPFSRDAECALAVYQSAVKIDGR